MRSERVIAPLGLMMALSFFTDCGSDPILPPSQTPADLAVLVISNTPAFDFGTVNLNVAVDKILDVTNDGTKPATKLSSDMISTAFSYKDGAFPGTGGDCGVALDVKASCKLVVTFKPTYAAAFQLPLILIYNDGEKDRSTKQGTEAPELKGRGQ